MHGTATGQGKGKSVIVHLGEWVCTKKKEKYVRKRNTDVASDYSTDLAAKGFANEIRDGKSFPNKSFY